MYLRGVLAVARGRVAGPSAMRALRETLAEMDLDEEGLTIEEIARGEVRPYVDEQTITD